MAGNDNEIIREMLEIFIEQVPEFTNGISNSFSSQNWEEMGALAHKAKSSLRTMGMEQLGDLLETLEHLSKGNQKMYLSYKLQKGVELNKEDLKCWNNVKNESEDDLELKIIPTLVDTFMKQFPLAVNELRQNLSEL